MNYLDGIRNKLNKYELSLAILVYSNYSVEEMSNVQHLSIHGIKYHLHKIFLKLGVKNQKEMRRLLLGLEQGKQ